LPAVQRQIEGLTLRASVNWARLRIALGGGQELRVLEKLEISLPSHACGAEKILDDEHGDRFVGGDYEGAFDAGLRVDQVVAALPAEGEAVLREDLDKCLVVGRPERRHQATLTVERSRETNSGGRHLSPSRS